MHVLLVTFSLEGLSEAEFQRGCDADAPAFADIPGMISKTWIADGATNTYGGIYAFRDRASLDAYIDSDLFQAIGQMDGVSGLTHQSFAVLEGPTRVTHGWAVQAA